jgi:hypothetical protein
MGIRRNPVVIERRAIKERAPITLHLPFPPSANTLFLNVSRASRIPTPTHQSWRAAAANAILRSRSRRMNGPVEIFMVFQERAGRRDIAIAANVCLEFLAAKGVIETEDSRVVRRLTLQWGDVPGAMIEIRSCDGAVTRWER